MGIIAARSHNLNLLSVIIPRKHRLAKTSVTSFKYYGRDYAQRANTLMDTPAPNSIRSPMCSIHPRRTNTILSNSLPLDVYRDNSTFVDGERER